MPGANYGTLLAVFETAASQSGKSIASENVANPTAMWVVGCIMLDYLQLLSCATSIRSAVLTPVESKGVCTPDIRGQGTTLYVIDHQPHQEGQLNGQCLGG